MKNFVQRWLANLSRQILAKHKPKIIGITGSVGKTSTRDAIYAVVSTAFSVRKGEKNFNNEFGLPFAILGVSGPERNIFKWLMVFVKGYFTLWFGSYPKVLILEMGVDKSGDMDYLLSIAKPDIAVLTNIGIAHYEFFKTSQAVAEEKGKLIEALNYSNQNGIAILNADNDIVKQQAVKAAGKGAKVITYGFAEDSDVRVRITLEQLSVPALTEIEVITHYNSFTATVKAVGVPHLSSVAAAVAVGLNLNISQEDIIKGLKNYKPVAGRLNFIAGIKKTTIIDDSYNASPDSVKQALSILARAPQSKKVVILGDMLELGELSEQAHKQIGELVAQLNPDRFFAVGNLANLMLDGAVSAGFPEIKTTWIENSELAHGIIRDQIEPESIILVKGSQGMRMEKISKELLLDPMSATNVLPRQYGAWLDS